MAGEEATRVPKSGEFAENGRSAKARITSVARTPEIKLAVGRPEGLAMVEGRDRKKPERDTLRPGAEFEPPTLVGKKSLGEAVAASAAVEAVVSRPQAMGLPWADVLAAAPPLGARLRALVETLHALSVLHTNLVRPPAERCHGALGPDSVLVTADGGASVFWRSLDTREASRLEPYIAPEVAAGSHPDQQADLYSVGVMLYEALWGRTPNPSNDEPLDGNEQLTALTQVALRAISPQPERRWRTALTFAEAISASAGPLLVGRDALAQVVADCVSRQERRLRELAIQRLRLPEPGPALPDVVTDPATDSFHVLVAPTGNSAPEAGDATHRSLRARAARLALLAGMVLFCAFAGYQLTRPKQRVDVAAVKAEPIIAIPASRRSNLAEIAIRSEATSEPVVSPATLEAASLPAPSALRNPTTPRPAKPKASSTPASNYEPEGI
jgi:hypothetical protein